MVIAVIWWRSLTTSTFYFPPLPHILETFQNVWLFDRVGSDLVPSLVRLGAGLAIGISAGIVVGFVLGRSPVLSRATAPLIEFCRAIPAPAVVPPLILMLGIGDTSKIALIAFGSVWPVLLNTVDGIRGIDPLLMETSRAFSVRRADTLARVVLPAAAPQIFAGIRTSLSLGIILMVISEMVGSTNGLGYFVIESQRSFAMTDMWAGIVLLGLLGYGLNAAFGLVERRALAWHRGARQRAS
ncbi:ABC transporter permease [Aeromicrobium camelliae]